MSIYETTTSEITKEGTVQVKSIVFTFTELEAIAAHRVIHEYVDKTTVKHENGVITCITKARLEQDQYRDWMLKTAVSVWAKGAASKPEEFLALRERADSLKAQVNRKTEELRNLAKQIGDAQKGGALTIEDKEARKRINEVERKLNHRFDCFVSLDLFNQEADRLNRKLDEIWDALRKLGWKPGESEEEEDEE